MQDRKDFSRDRYATRLTAEESSKTSDFGRRGFAVSSQNSTPHLAPRTVVTHTMTEENIPSRPDGQPPMPSPATSDNVQRRSPRQELVTTDASNNRGDPVNMMSSMQTESSPSLSDHEYLRPWSEYDWLRWRQRSMNDPFSGEPGRFTIPAPSQITLPPIHTVLPTSILQSSSAMQRQTSNPRDLSFLANNDAARSGITSAPPSETSTERSSTFPASSLPFSLRNLPPLPSLSVDSIDRMSTQPRLIAVPVSRLKKMRQSARSACTACLDQFDTAALIRLGCSCTYCSPCLNRLVESACNSAADFPPRCHGTALRISVYGPTLTSEVSKRYKEVEAEFSSRNPLYCAQSRCSAFIKQENVIQDNRVGICEKCRECTCTSCKMLLADHRVENGQRHCPAEPKDVQALRDLSQQEYWMQCPACRSMVEKLDGCDHIACICGVEFCYHCGSHFDEDNGCKCDVADAQDIDESDDEDVWPDHRRMFDTIGRQKCWHLDHEATDGELCHGCLSAPVDDDFYSCNECHSVLCERCMASNISEHIHSLEREYIEGIHRMNKMHSGAQNQRQPSPSIASISTIANSNNTYAESLRQFRDQMMAKWEFHKEARNETWDEHVARMEETDSADEGEDA